MSSFAAALPRLAAIPNLKVLENVSLASYTRFDIGGPAAIFCDAGEESAFCGAIEAVAELELPHIVIGGGTNLIVSGQGFAGVVIRYTGSAIHRNESELCIEAGAVLQDVVDRSIELGLQGLETMTGIPGYLGGAVYGNAGAYGRSIQELIHQVRAFDGQRLLTLTNEDCRFHYRESIFKERKNWIILSAALNFTSGDRCALAKTAAEIRSIRDAKYPPSMKCAGSIFKNLLLKDLPAHVIAAIPENVIREGKVPSAWFLDQTGVKGMRRGGIQIADYHANLIYNAGNGTATDLVTVIREAKRRVGERFGFDLEEEVQYVGF